MLLYKLFGLVEDIEKRFFPAAIYLFKFKNGNTRTISEVSGESVNLSLAGRYMFKVNNINTRSRCEICSKLTIKTPERHKWCRSGVFIVNFEHISQFVLVFLLLTLSN